MKENKIRLFGDVMRRVNSNIVSKVFVDINVE